MTDTYFQQSNESPPGAVVNLSPLVTALQLANQNMSQLIQKIGTTFPAEAPTLSSLSVAFSTAVGNGTLIKEGSGFLMAISANTTAAATVAGKAYDANSAINAGSTNVMTLIPLSGTQSYAYPFVNGLVVQPSSTGSQSISVFYI
jgi:hypothetical protein